MKSTAHVDEEVRANVLEFDLHGKLSREDYEELTPEIESLIDQYGTIRVLVIMRGFHGWDAGAFWEAIKWNSRHFRHIERLAVVGEEAIDVRDGFGAFDLSYSRKVRWQKWMTNFYRAFAHARVRYFTLEELDEAREWLNEDQAGSTVGRGIEPETARR
ncbi:MAG: STAS/SEC14 domain-containing protein [Chthoniobacter sp.]|nr:STAS/SEC14 domain-containing protein [Chthoniobacter sp.]